MKNTTPRTGWRKSSYSDGQNNCVMLARLDDSVGIRDSKQGESGDVLTFSPAELGAFVQAVKDGSI